MRVGPFNPTVLPKKRYVLYYLFLMWISIISILLEFWFYWQWLWDFQRPLHFYLFLPLLCFVMYLTIVFVSLLLAKILLLIVNAVHKPKTGVFLRDLSDRDYRFWCIRNIIKRWPVWLSHKFPFPFLDNVCFKVFGVKTTMRNSLFEGWVDCEFIEFGKNVVVGEGSIVQSAILVGNLLIIRKTVIEDDVRIGAHCVVMPGTHVQSDCILAANSVTTVNQELEEGHIYLGIPAKKYKKNRYFEDGLEDELKQAADPTGVRKKYEKVYTKAYHELEEMSIRDKWKRRKKLKEQEKKRMDEFQEEHED